MGSEVCIVVNEYRLSATSLNRGLLQSTGLTSMVHSDYARDTLITLHKG